MHFESDKSALSRVSKANERHERSEYSTVVENRRLHHHNKKNPVPKNGIGAGGGT